MNSNLIYFSLRNLLRNLSMVLFVNEKKFPKFKNPYQWEVRWHDMCVHCKLITSKLIVKCNHFIQFNFYETKPLYCNWHFKSFLSTSNINIIHTRTIIDDTNTLFVTLLVFKLGCCTTTRTIFITFVSLYLRKVLFGFRLNLLSQEPLWFTGIFVILKLYEIH